MQPPDYFLNSAIENKVSHLKRRTFPLCCGDISYCLRPCSRKKNGMLVSVSVIGRQGSYSFFGTMIKGICEKIKSSLFEISTDIKV